jgi:hypothetical protein
MTWVRPVFRKFSRASAARPASISSVVSFAAGAPQRHRHPEGGVAVGGADFEDVLVVVLEDEVVEEFAVDAGDVHHAGLAVHAVEVGANRGVVEWFFGGSDGERSQRRGGE